MVNVSWKIPKFYIHYGFYRKFFSLCQKNFASIFAKTEFWQKFGWKTKILHFRNDFWVLFISSSGAHINFPNFQIPLDLFSRVISSSRGEQAKNWGLKTQKFKVLSFEPNFKGRLNMASEGTPWPNSIKKHLTNWFIHDSSEEHAFHQSWVWTIQAPPNSVRWSPNSRNLILVYYSMSGKTRKCFHQ